MYPYFETPCVRFKLPWYVRLMDALKRKPKEVPLRIDGYHKPTYPRDWGK